MVNNNECGILEIPGDTGYWLVRADGGKYYEDFFLNNFISISDNKITLEMIKKCDNDSIAGITVENYKDLYQEKYDDWNAQQIAHATSRTQKFVDEMKIGDLLLVPSRKSTNFLIGIITSDVFEISEDELGKSLEIKYAINPYLKRREVQWLKEVSRTEISEKLYWILSAHQTIFNLSEHKQYINQLLSPIYIQDNICHGTLKIGTESGLDQDDWYNLYSIIKYKSDGSNGKVIVKSNVQSPGIIEFVTSNASTILAVTTVLSGALFGEIKIAGLKFQGVLSYFQSYRKQKLEIEKMKKEIVMMDEDKRSKEIQNDRAQFELDRDKTLWENKKLELEAERLRTRLQISSFDAGRVLGIQTQMDSSENPDEDKS